MILLMHSNHPPSAEHLQRLEAALGGARVSVARSEADALEQARQAQIVFGHRYLRQIIPHAPKLRWVQSSAAGFDHLPWRELQRRDIALSLNPTNAPVIAEHVLALSWALQRRLPDAFAAQQRGEWAQPFAMLSPPRTALVLGLGQIGRAVGRRLRALGIFVIGCARSGSAEQRAACDHFVAGDAWRAQLPQTDLLVIAVPLTDATHRLLGAAEFALLPPSAIVINVSRGAVVDTDALGAALRAGRLGGAGLDVLEPVPPATDALWRTPNLLITPKVAAYDPQMRARFEAFSEAQLQRWLLRQPLEARADLDTLANTVPTDTGD